MLKISGEGKMSTTDVNQIFAKNMRLRRKQLGISQEKLGELSGLHRTYIGGIEQFLRNPSIQSMEKIANALNIEISILTMKNYEKIMNSEYAVCHLENDEFNFIPIDVSEINSKYIKMLDELCGIC